MSTGRRAAGNKRDDGFTTRTVMAMATELAEARDKVNRVCVLFEPLARAHGVKVEWDQTSM